MSGQDTATRGLGERQAAPSVEAPDLRPSFALERRITPALFVVGALAALFSGAGRTAAVMWLALFVVNAAARFVLASEFERARRPVAITHVAANLYAASYAFELVLWAAWLGSLLPPSQVIGVSSFAAAGSVLLAASTLSRWPQAWAVWVVGWLAVMIVAIGRVPGPVALPAMALLLWGAAVWWIGSARTRVARGEDGGARVGWIAAVQAMPTPVLVLRRGRIADLNNAAANFLSRPPQALVGERAEACLRADPAHALDPTVGGRASRAARIAPVGVDARSAPWAARVRVLNPGRLDSAIVVSLMPPAGPVDNFAEDARRLVQWLGARAGQPWYRDETGQVFLPAGFPSAAPLSEAGMSFPLAAWVVPDQRMRVETDYRLAQAHGRVFDRRIHLIDSEGKARALRVTCLPRPGSDPGQAAAIGTIGPVQPGADIGSDGNWTHALPVLVWWVDNSGLVERVHGADVWRWGMQIPETEPSSVRWSDAIAFDADARRDMLGALQKALSGRPSFDLLNRRRTRTGALVAVRSHVVPFTDATDRRGALVMDTVAAPHMLNEVERLRRGRDHYRKLVEASTSLIWACDAQFNFTFVSKRAAREIYGYQPSELMGRSIGSLLADDVDQSAARQAIASLRLGQPLRSFEMVQRARDGQRVIVAVDAAPLKGTDGSFAGALGMSADLTMLKQRERRLVEALRIERTVLDAAGQAIAVIKDGLVARCNEALLKLLLAQPVQLARTPVADYLAHPDEWPEIAAAADAGREADRAVAREVQIARGGRDSGQEPIWCQMTARSIATGEYVLVLADISHIRNREAEALHHAHHDELTGLPNRRLLAMRGAAALVASGLRNSSCAVLAIDLDGFKEINDQHGHEVGDLVLREIAQRLTRLLRPQDTVARRGGDEFAMLVPDVGGRADVERIAVRLLHAVEQPVMLAPGVQRQLSASVGIALAPDQGRDLERLMQLADHAMYEAKLRGKNRYAFAGTPAAAAVVTPITASAPRAARAS